MFQTSWRFAGGPMMGPFKCYVDPLSSPNRLKTLLELQSWIPLTKLSGSAHGENVSFFQYTFINVILD